MAYRTRSTRRAAPKRRTRSTVGRASPRRGRARAGYSARPAASRTRRAASPRTIRIVIEQPQANAVARPPIGMVTAPEPRKAAF